MTPQPRRLDRVGQRETDAHHRRRSVARAALVRSRRSAGTRLVRVERLPRAHAAPRGARRPRTPPVDRWGTGAGAARLIVGSRPVHDELEAELAAWKGAEAAVLFSTGFAANLGVLGTFAGPDTLVCSDELNHASLIDGAPARGRAARGATATPTPPTSTSCCARPTHRAPSSSPRPCSPWTATSRRSTSSLEVCAHHGALLVLDEAHAVLGPEPDDATLAGIDHLRVGTLSKTLGALGGFVAGRSQLTDLLVNRARSLHLHHRVDPGRLRGRARRAAHRAAHPRATTCASACAPTSSASAPVTRRRSCRSCAASEARALAAAEALAARGLLVTAIRPPTVPPGTSRLRVALSAAHTPEQVDTLAAALAELFPDDVRSAHDPSAHVGVRRRAPATEVGKTWWTAATAPRAARRGRARSAARKPVQSGDPGDGHRRRGAGRRDRRGSRRGVPAAPHATTWRGRRRWRPASWAPPASPPPTSPAGSSGRRRSTSGSSKGSAARARRSATTATTSTSRTCSPPTSWWSSPTPASAPSTRCGCRWRRSRASRSSSHSTASAATRSTDATSSTSSASTASTWSPNHVTLADRLRLRS